MRLFEGYVRNTIDNIEIVYQLRELPNVYHRQSPIQGPRYYHLKYYIPEDKDLSLLRPSLEISQERYRPRAPEVDYKDFMALRIVPEEARLKYIKSLLTEVTYKGLNQGDCVANAESAALVSATSIW